MTNEEEFQSFQNVWEALSDDPVEQAEFKRKILEMGETAQQALNELNMENK